MKTCFTPFGKKQTNKQKIVARNTERYTIITEISALTPTVHVIRSLLHRRDRGKSQQFGKLVRMSEPPRRNRIAELRSPRDKVKV